MRDRPPRPRPTALPWATTTRHPFTPEELDDLSRRTREKLAALRRRSFPASENQGPPHTPLPSPKP
jgi:hypothetical protein